MFGLSVLLSVAIAAKAVLSTPIHSRSAYAVKETHNPPRKWTQVGRAPADHMIHLQIGLKQSQFEELERHLYEVSDPEHVRYGQHLSVEEVNELVKPTDEALGLVHEWLFDNGIGQMDYSPAKDWVNVYIDVGSAERLLETEYFVFEHEDGAQLIRAPKWSLPFHLHEHVDAIQPTTSFMRTELKSQDYIQFDSVWTPPDYKPPTNATLSKVCKFASATPECFMTLYSTLGYEQESPGVNKISFNNFLAEVPIRPDAAKFLKKYRPQAVPRAYDFKQIDIAGGPSQDGPITPEQIAAARCREANLDVQTIIGMTYPMPVYAYSTGGSPPFNPDAATTTNTNEPYLTWVNYVLGQSTLPQVVSTSYGDDEQSVPKDYAIRVCSQFAQLGARGVSILFSSGDGGVGSGDPSVCVTNDGKNTTTFLPSFPAGCPFVTTVGATQQFEPEVSAYRPAGSIGPDGRVKGFYSSGSGFSNYFPRPKYQEKVVTPYVKALNGKYDGLYNKAGRGYPDLAAQGIYFAYVWNGTEGIISGTSASCPLMSSVIALVNDALISSGRPPLGFLNPWLYSKGYKGFTDILSGSAYGCGTEGFPVTKGWDAVTGFGTPVFPELVALAKGRSHEDESHEDDDN